VQDGDRDERVMRVDGLGERLGALRLCDPTSLARVQQSLVRHGQLSAVAVFAPDGARVEIVDGFKRLRAARALGWTELRARVIAIDSVAAKIAIDALHERSGLTDLEQAWLVRSLYRDDGLRQPEIGRLLGRHKSWVCRRLLLAETLDDAVQADVRLGLLSATAATSLAQLPRCNQQGAADAVTRTGMTSRQAALFVAELLACEHDEARAALVRERLVRPSPRSPPHPAHRARTEAEWLLADVATVTRVAARLQARLLAGTLATLAPRAAEVVTDAVTALVPVLDALARTLSHARRKDSPHVAPLALAHRASAPDHHAARPGAHAPSDRAGPVGQPQHGP
jgi:ParB-like chromosome segregation protein Spo0J